MDFDSILASTQYSTRETAKAYFENMPQSEIDRVISMQNAEIDRIKDKYNGADISDTEIMRTEIQSYVAKLVPYIQSDYGEYIPKDRVENLYRLMNDSSRIIVVNDEKYDHDFSANSADGMIIVNLAKIGISKEHPNPSIYRKVASATGILPHELFHFVIQMLNPEYMETERMRINLSNGEQISTKGMVGFMLNEGFVEKTSSEFCDNHGFYHMPSIQYYPYIDVCNYVMENNPNVNDRTIFCLDKDDCLNGLSKDDKDKYHNAEAVSYAVRHQDKKATDVVSSSIEPVERDDSRIPEVTNARLERSKFYKDQKKEELLHDDKGKVLTKGEENQSNDNNDSSSSRNEGTTE